jgi:pimeloyl-ACP methyl ester carboxylesterase
MKQVATFLLVLCAWSAQGQFEVGQTDWLLIDASRNDREIPCIVWYPAQVDGVTPAEGGFPTFVMAHGFVMSPLDYEGLAAALVSEGYVFASLGTEQGFAPSHADYGLDLAFVADQVAAAEISGVLSASSNGRVAIGGHSMGGGAAWLAAAEQPAVDAVVVFAPAETNPSAIAAGEEITVPVLVVSGADDAVTPPTTQHEPIYASAVNAPCRAFVSIAGGGHCGFADPGTLCDFGELGFSGLSHAEQLALSLDVVLPWLAHFVEDNPGGLAALEEACEVEPELELSLSCALDVAADAEAKLEWSVFPNPNQGSSVLRNASSAACWFTVWNSLGQSIQHEQQVLPGCEYAMQLDPGTYIIRLRNGKGDVQSARLLVF